MALELVYTSAQRGLREGTSGFCTVAMTRGLPPTMVSRLEALGGYRPGPRGDGPVALSFWRLETGTGVVSVLARVGPAAPDHTQRTNKLATYLVLGPEEQCEAGPAWLLGHMALREKWEGAPRWIENPVAMPQQGDLGPAICRTWADAAGDAGWAGALASAFLRDMSKPAHIIYREGTDVLALAAEAQRLLPPWARWRATFSTYFVLPVAGAPCCWRFCLEGTAAAEGARASKGLLMDLTRAMGRAAESRHVRAARTGVLDAAEVDAQEARHPAATSTGTVGMQVVAGFTPAEADGGHIELEPTPSHRQPTWGQRYSARARREGETVDDAAETPRFAISRGVLVALGTGLVVIVALLTVGLGLPGLLGKGSALPLPPPPAPPVPGPTPVEPSAQVPSSVQQHAKVSPEPAPPIPTEPTRTSLPESPGPPDESVPIVLPTVPTVPSTRATEAPKADVPAEVQAVPAGPPPWIVLRWIDGQAELTARERIPADLNAVAAQFVVPQSLQAAGFSAQQDLLILPGGAGSTPIAAAKLQDGMLTISLAVRGQELDHLSSIFKPSPNPAPVAIARAILQRVPVELTDAAGAVVARVRVDQPRQVVRVGSSGLVQVPLHAPEDALTVEVRMVSRQHSGNAADAAHLARGGSAVLKLAGTEIAVDWPAPNALRMTIPPMPSAPEVESARLFAEMRTWQELRNAGADLLKTAGPSGYAVTPERRSAAFQMVQKALNAEERAMLKDSKGKDLDLADFPVIRRVIPPFVDRCEREGKKAQKAAEAVKQQASQHSEVPAIDVIAEDGVTLATVYPEGLPK